jgi:hypothetical protein
MNVKQFEERKSVGKTIVLGENQANATLYTINPSRLDFGSNPSPAWLEADNQRSKLIFSSYLERVCDKPFRI